jgi:tRNA A37 threonylcarbamoyltransferase TsaD
MIAWVGIERLKRGRVDGLEVMQKSKWGIEECEKEFDGRT